MSREVVMASAELGCLLHHLIEIGNEVVEVFGGRIPHRGPG